MKKILRAIKTIITAPFRWFFGLFANTCLGALFAPDPEDTPIGDTLGKAMDSPQTFWEGLAEHLMDLRKSLIRATLALVITTAISFAYITPIMDWLSTPVGGIEKLQAIEVTESVGVVMRVAFLSGLTLALPFIFFQILCFIAPGISRRARMIGFIGIPFVLVFFIGGVLFAFNFMLDPALGVLLNFMDIHTIPRPSSYFNFTTGLLFWIGIAFEFPLVSFILSSMHILSPKALRDQWRLAFIVLAVLAAAITPTIDPVNMLIVLVPLWTLYGLSILMAYLARGKKETIPNL